MGSANVFINNTVVDSRVFKELKKQLKESEGDTTARGLNRVAPKETTREYPGKMPLRSNLEVLNYLMW